MPAKWPHDPDISPRQRDDVPEQHAVWMVVKEEPPEVPDEPETDRLTRRVQDLEKELLESRNENAALRARLINVSAKVHRMMTIAHDVIALSSSSDRDAETDDLTDSDTQLERQDDDARQTDDHNEELVPGSKVFLPALERSKILVRCCGDPRSIVASTLRYFFTSKELSKMCAVGRTGKSSLPTQLANALHEFANTMRKKQPPGLVAAETSPSGRRFRGNKARGFTAMTAKEFVQVVNQTCHVERQNQADIGRRVSGQPLTRGKRRRPDATSDTADQDMPLEIVIRDPLVTSSRETLTRDPLASRDPLINEDTKTW